MKHIIVNLLFLINSIFLILYMGLSINKNTALDATGCVSLFLSSLMLIDITYISSCNVRENKIIALFYGIQFLAGWLCFIFIVVFHRKRPAFVIKAEWKCILFSLVVVTILFLAYYFSTTGVSGRLSTTIYLWLTSLTASKELSILLLKLYNDGAIGMSASFLGLRVRKLD